MSRSAKGPVRNSLLFLGAAAFVAAAWFGLSRILHADAFAKFGSAAPSGAEVGVTMGGVEFKGYEKGRLAATAKADKIEVRRDRSIFDMSGVRNGTFIDKDGKKLAFDMKDATFEYFRNKLTAESGAHVKGEDFDLTSDQVVYEKAKSKLAVN